MPSRSLTSTSSPAAENDILAQAAGITVGTWWASPATHVGHELVVAGMLIMAGDRLDYDESVEWSRVGYERATAPTHAAR